MSSETKRANHFFIRMKESKLVTTLAVALILAFAIIGALGWQYYNDPIKRLNRMGIPFSEDAFVDATKAGNIEVVELFISGGMSPNIISNKTNMPIILEAITDRRIPVSKFLIEKGADLKGFNKQGDTALHISVRNGDIDIVKALVEKKIALNEKNIAQETPLDIAIATKNDILTSYLQSVGAKRNVNRNYKQSAVTYIKDRTKYGNYTRKEAEVDYTGHGDIVKIVTADKENKKAVIYKDDKPLIELPTQDKDIWCVAYLPGTKKPAIIYMATHDYLDKLDSVKIFGDKGNGDFGVLLDSLSLQPGVAFGPSFDIRESSFVFEYAVDTFAGQFIRNEAVVNYSVDENKLTLGPRKTVYNSMNQVTTTRTASAPVNVPSNAIPVRQLLAAPYDYVGKNIIVGPLKVLTNDISGRTVRSYQATGQNYDTDLSAPLEILYWQSPDENKWVNLPDFAIIYVKGTYYGTLMATELIRVK